jgi:hypothetical protein
MNLNEQIEQVIEKEIKQGYMEIEEDDMMSLEVSLEDMELMCSYLQSVLKKQFVKFPTPKEYTEKIKELFDVEFTGRSTILYDQGIGELEPKTVLVQSDESSGSMFLSNEGFITLPLRLPEFINYQKHFPHLVKLEDEMEKQLEKEEDETLILWKEIVGDKEEYKQTIVDNLYYVIRLNNYLFNNEKKYLDWLYEQNPFLEMLVSAYGYNEDIELVEKVINERGVDENFYLDDLVWFKGSKRLYDIEEEPLYDGEFKIQHNTFMVIYNKLEDQKFHVPTQNVYLKALHRMLVELDEEEILNKKEKEKLTSYLIDFLDEFLLDSSNLESLERE